MDDFKKVSSSSFESLSTEELESLLQKDLDSPDTDKLSFEEVREIVGIIKEREQQAGTYKPVDVDSAWTEFNRVYLTGDEGVCEERPDEVPGSLKKITFISWRRFFAIAAVISVMMSTLLTAQGFGLDLLGTIARWTECTFHYELSLTGSSAQMEPSVLELSEDGLPEEYAPTWYPEGYEMGEPQILKWFDGEYLYVPFYGEGEEFFYIQLGQLSTQEAVEALVLEKSQEDMNFCTMNSKQFYVMTNETSSTATYSENLTFMVISGTLTNSDLKHMIRSIGG